jgi:hypothetical protein
MKIFMLVYMKYFCEKLVFPAPAGPAIAPSQEPTPLACALRDCASLTQTYQTGPH